MYFICDSQTWPLSGHDIQTVMTERKHAMWLPGGQNVSRKQQVQDNEVPCGFQEKQRGCQWLQQEWKRALGNGLERWQGENSFSFIGHANKRRFLLKLKCENKEILDRSGEAIWCTFWKNLTHEWIYSLSGRKRKTMWMVKYVKQVINHRKELWVEETMKSNVYARAINVWQKKWHPAESSINIMKKVDLGTYTFVGFEEWLYVPVSLYFSNAIINNASFHFQKNLCLEN